MTLAVTGLVAWDAAFNAPYRARLAALDAIPPGPFLAIDAAAWRYIADRPVIVTPADSLALGVCVGTRYHVSSLVLEPAHFSAYDELYRDGSSELLQPPIARGDIRVYPL